MLLAVPSWSAAHHRPNNQRTTQGRPPRRRLRRLAWADSSQPPWGRAAPADSDSLLRTSIWQEAPACVPRPREGGGGPKWMSFEQDRGSALRPRAEVPFRSLSRGA